MSFYTKSECIEHSKEEYEFSLEKYMNEVEHLLQKEQRKRLISKRDVEDLVEVIDSCLNSDRHSRMTVEELMIYPYFEVKKSHSKSSKSKKKKASATKKRSRKVSKIGNFYTV
jgi:serine/threonine protein kinase